MLQSRSLGSLAHYRAYTARSLGLRTLLPIIGLIQHLYGVSEASIYSQLFVRINWSGLIAF